MESSRTLCIPFAPITAPHPGASGKVSKRGYELELDKRYIHPHLPIPPLRALIAFDAVARLGSFSRAADELCITPSAVSHRIAQLESQLGTALLLRVGPLVSLTPRGRELLPHVHEGLEALRAGLAKIAKPVLPRVRLTLAPAIASHWLIPRLPAFQRTHPDIDVDILVTSRNVNIRAGEADVGIRFGTGRWEGLESSPLLPARIFPVCSPAYRTAHPWLRQPQDLLRATLLRQRVIPWRPWFEAAGLDAPEPGSGPTSGPSFSEISLAIDAAEHAHGVALALDVLTEKHLERGTLIRLFDIELTSDRSYCLVVPSNAQRPPETQALIDWLLDLSTAARKN
ncbi:MAG: Glycine cleavage system transcriptional activator [Rhodocyclaceae bacterium]|nr:Glycine cleavage system transcriptional activator [Rhodocyclaceae bacterium]